MITIKLTNAEIMQAAMAGVVRRMTSFKEGYNKNIHAEKSDWATDIDGAACELALAKHKCLYWNAGNRTFKSPDLTSFTQWHCRSTCHQNGHLIIRPNDRGSTGRWVLGITNMPFVNLIGWIELNEAINNRFWRDDKNGWWIPQESLSPLETDVINMVQGG